MASTGGAAPLDQLVQDTMKTLGKCIKKPPLAAKLLAKPPFRFLHDIVTELIRTTGYLEGLFTPDEKDSSKVTEKQAKMDFLQKAIDATCFAINKSLAAKPSKIVAGLDPENTNIWLQAMAYAVHKKIDSKKAVQRVLNGEKPSKSSKEKKSANSRETHNPPSESAADNTVSPPRPADAAPPASSAAAAPTHSSLASEEGRPRTVRPESARHKPGGRELPRPNTSRQGRSAAAEAAADSQHLAASTEAKGANEAREDIGANDSVMTAAQEDEMRRSLRTQRGQRSQAAREAEEDSMDASGSQQLAGEDGPLPGNVQRILRERPSSARPAPPRSRKAGSGQQDARDVMGLNSEGPRVFAADNGADDDDFVVGDAQKVSDENALPAQASLDAQIEADDGGEQGALMRKIMAKKAAEQSEGEDGGRNPGQRRLEREQAEREVAQLRESVQTLCRASNPLGKVIDYIQEDVDSMRKEMQQWRKEVQENTANLADKTREANDALEPLKAQLADLEQQIKDREGMVTALRAKTLENDLKIQRLLSGPSA